MSDDKFTFLIGGIPFACEVNYDNDHGMPWEEFDGHGEIRTIRSREDKKPGEVIIHSDGHTYWVYNSAAAVKTARADGWGSKNCTPDMTLGQRAAQATTDDMRYCREWLTGDRWFVWLEVYRVDADGEKIGDSETLGGVECGFGETEYMHDAAMEMGQEILRQSRNAWRAALKEARERKYWATRDVATHA